MEDCQCRLDRAQQITGSRWLAHWTANAHDAELSLTTKARWRPHRHHLHAFDVETGHLTVDKA